MMGASLATLSFLGLVLIFLRAVYPLQRNRATVSRELVLNALMTVVVLSEVYLLQVFFPWALPSSGEFRLLYFLMALLGLDLLSYAWHWLNHRLPLLWRFHKFHHRAKDLDALMAYRFHPVEVFLGFQIRSVVVLVLGFNAEELALFLHIYSASNLIQHSGVRFPYRVEKVLSKIIITPRVHTVHHSVVITNQLSNFGTIFSFWDRIFGSFVWDEKTETMPIGLKSNLDFPTEEQTP